MTYMPAVSMIKVGDSQYHTEIVTAAPELSEDTKMWRFVVNVHTSDGCIVSC